MKLKKLSIFLITLFFLSACGYAPSSKIADNLFNEKVYVNVELSAYDPQNSVFIADNLKEVVISKLGRKLALKHEADDIINVRINKLEFYPLIYDQNGYVIRYKASLSLSFLVVSKDGKTQHFSTSGSYNFNISPNSVISDNAKSMAIKESASQAFDEFISIIAIKGKQSDAKYR